MTFFPLVGEVDTLTLREWTPMFLIFKKHSNLRHA